MPELLTSDQLAELAETVELECKLAQGQDGKGELTKDFWPTYSAFANTDGGLVVLGLRERDRRFSVAGLANIEKIRTDLFNTLNNPSKVSANLLTDANVSVRLLDGKQILLVHVPPATRKQRPVFLNGQPIGNTYRRLHEGDRRCDEESVKRMFAEQVEDSRDERIQGGSSEHKGTSSEHKGVSSEHSELPATRRDGDGCLLSDYLDVPLIDSLDELNDDLWGYLHELSKEPRERLRMQPARMREVISELCEDHYLTLNVLAELLCRSPDALRQQYLNRMVKSRQIQLAFPSKPTHIRQAYRATSPGASDEP
ncbi:hypothetical protein ACVW0Y_002628 [Pseudomonas sp. TE3786]